jgi:hypothetical protein
MARKEDRFWLWISLAIPVLGILWVWLSSLSFVPVPWPDDSAFYFPAKDLFSWPPRWVMIPQAPFEPSYREWNFNTMPGFPILIGIARLVGIDGSHGLKLLPLAGWLASCLIAVRALGSEPRSRLLLVGSALVFAFDPILRWSSVLVRPESIIGACGIAILYGYRFGWPHALRERRFFHPVSLFLAIGAYLHFNAIHLVPVVIALYWSEPRKILKIGALTAAALAPWMVTITMKPALFAMQMELQFNRLSGYHNPWLGSWRDFTRALFSDMGSPEPWSAGVEKAIIACVFALPLLFGAMVALFPGRAERARRALVGGFVWVLSSAYLWHTKAEVWFTHFIHLSFLAWATLVIHEAIGAWRSRAFAAASALLPVALGAVFFYEQGAQASRLSEGESWKWSTYRDLIDCVDGFLSAEEARVGHPKPFRVWAPTFPDILIELSRKHPDWEFTRTNDFFRRWNLGVAHGREVEAMVVPETYRRDERFYGGPLAGANGARSVWMTWDQYYLVQLERDPTFKPRRFLCQRGRWDAFIYLPAETGK